MKTKATIKPAIPDAERTAGSLHRDGSADWQRVTDTLPPMDTPCWLWDGKKIWIGGRGMVDSEYWLWGNAYSSIWHNGVKWDADNETDDDYQPTHWMSLPNPPNDPSSDTADMKAKNANRSADVGCLKRVVRRRKRCFYCSNWARGGKRKGSALCQSCYNNDWGFHQ